MQSNGSPAARIWNLVRQEKTDITAIYFFAALGGLIQLSLPVGIQAIIGFVIGGTLSISLIVLITFLVLGVLLTGVMQINQMKVIERVQQRIFVRYSFLFANKIPRLAMDKIDGIYLPELVNRFFETVSLQKSFSKLLLDLPTAFIQILLGLILLSFYHPLFILFSVLLLLLLWLIIYITGNKGLQTSLTESRHKYSVAAWLQEMARLIKSFKFSMDGGLHLHKADKKVKEYIGTRTQHFGILLTQFRVMVAFKVIITAALLVTGVALLLDQQINIGQFVAAEIIIITVIGSIEKIIINLDSAYDVLTAVEKLEKLTDKPIENSGSFMLSTQDSIAFEGRDLSFGYDPAKQVIKNTSFHIPKHSITCITGPDGSGKSTLLKLLTGVYENYTGALLLNGIPLGNYHLPSFRESSGMYFPNENIFHGTLWENISMGKQGLDKKYIVSLCRTFGLDRFLASLPGGFDTELDPTGKRLPGNVIQKILLVRALAHKPRLLILEEPWQGIEAIYRQSIQQFLVNMKQTTVIVASSDETFAAQCDQVIYLTHQ